MSLMTDYYASQAIRLIQDAGGEVESVLSSFLDELEKVASAKGEVLLDAVKSMGARRGAARRATGEALKTSREMIDAVKRTGQEVAPTQAFQRYSATPGGATYATPRGPAPTRAMAAPAKSTGQTIIAPAGDTSAILNMGRPSPAAPSRPAQLPTTAPMARPAPAAMPTPQAAPAAPSPPAPPQGLPAPGPTPPPMPSQHPGFLQTHFGVNPGGQMPRNRAAMGQWFQGLNPHQRRNVIGAIGGGIGAAGVGAGLAAGSAMGNKTTIYS